MKKVKMLMGAVLCMNLLAVSGCDSVVQSAVVEEKNPIKIPVSCFTV